LPPSSLCWPAAAVDRGVRAMARMTSAFITTDISCR
jgi:hypothetical protein